MDKNHKVANEIANDINLAFNCAMAYRDNKDKFYYEAGRKALRNLVNKYSDILESLPCENKWWIAFSFAAATLK